MEKATGSANGNDIVVPPELQRKRNETYAKWIKEVALLFLAALVVQNIVSGISVVSPVVIIGGIVSIALYYQAYLLIEKS
jgi:hypothetical protein